MSANVEILGEKRAKAVSVPLEALQRRDSEVVVYRLKSGLQPKQISAARRGSPGERNSSGSPSTGRTTSTRCR